MKKWVILLAALSIACGQEIFLSREDSDIFMVETDLIETRKFTPKTLLGIGCNFVEDYSFFTFTDTPHP